MADSRLSHRTNIQFCVKLGKWAKDTYAKLLKEAFEEDSCSYSTVKRYANFKANKREGLCDEPSSEWPWSATSAKEVKNVKSVIFE